MPEFRYAGPGERAYTEGRDLSGVLIGTVEPGDVRDLDEAPDQWWFPAGDGEERSDEDGAAAGQPAEPSGPVPAPPAVIPSA